MKSHQKMFETWAASEGYDLTKRDGTIYVNDETEHAYYGFLGALGVVKQFVVGMI